VALELRTLPEGLAEIVARHLAAAERALENEDAILAGEHMAMAKYRAGRSAVVREASGIVLYRLGQFSEALQDLRAAKRMSGDVRLVPLIADCERGLGKPAKALETIKLVDLARVDPDTRVELLIVAAGARADMGKPEAAVLTLQGSDLTKLPPGTARARLQYAYSEMLSACGRTNEAWEWMERAAASDVDDATDAAQRCNELEGIAFSVETDEE